MLVAVGWMSLVVAAIFKRSSLGSNSNSNNNSNSNSNKEEKELF